MSWHRHMGLIALVCIVMTANAGLGVAVGRAASSSDAAGTASLGSLQAAPEPIPDELDIGTVTVGNTTTKSFTVTNPSNFTLKVSGSSITGEDADAFIIVDGGGSVTIGPGESHAFTVEFAPTRPGDHDATLTVSSNAPGSPHSTALDGQGKELPNPTAELTPDDGDFGNAEVGSEVTKSFVLENTGEADLKIDDVTVSGSDAFGVDAGDVSTLEPNAKTTIAVTFVPTESGTNAGTLSISSNDPDNPTVSASLTGEGVETSLSVSPGSVTFGEQRAGSTETQSIEVTNDGDTSVSVTEVGITGEDSDSFEIASESPKGTLAPGESVSIDVSFSPWRAGGFGARLSIGTSSSELEPIDVSLSGTGDAPKLSTNPGSINFGKVEVDSRVTRTVLVRNKGSVPLTVDETKVVGGDPEAFSVVSGGGSFTLGPGEDQTVTVAFEPTSGGTKAAQLRFVSDDPDNPQTDVWLSNTRTVVNVERETNQNTGETTTNLAVQDAQPDSSVTVNVSQGPSADSVGAIRFGVGHPDSGPPSLGGVFCSGLCLRGLAGSSDDYDGTVTLTTVEAPLPEAPAFGLRERDGTVALSFMRVESSGPESRIRQVVFTKRVSKERLAELNASIEEYAMYRHVDGDWVELDSTVIDETGDHYVVEVTSPGLSYFASGVKQPRLEVIDAVLRPATAASGDALEVLAEIRNSGAADGTATATVRLDGDVVERTDFTVAADEARDLEFDVELTRPGTYTLVIDGMEVDRLEVTSAAIGGGATDSPSGSESEDDEGTRATTSGGDTVSPPTGMPGFTVVTALVAFLAIILFSGRRQRE